VDFLTSNNALCTCAVGYLCERYLCLGLKPSFFQTSFDASCTCEGRYCEYDCSCLAKLSVFVLVVVCAVQNCVALVSLVV
jgi:hypothetical protein